MRRDGEPSVRRGARRFRPGRGCLALRPRAARSRPGAGSARLGARCWATGPTCDAHHRVRLDDSGEEPARAMAEALADAGLSPTDVDYVQYHGTATLLNDRIETRATKLALGARADAVPGSSVKSQVGHPQGASGAAGPGGDPRGNVRGFPSRHAQPGHSRPRVRPRLRAPAPAPRRRWRWPS